MVDPPLVLPVMTNGVEPAPTVPYNRLTTCGALIKTFQPHLHILICIVQLLLQNFVETQLIPPL